MTKAKTQTAPVNKQKSERTGYDTPEITGLNMHYIFVGAVTKVVFPAMQRTYSWGAEQLQRFFNNLYMDRYINQDTSAIGMFELYISDTSTRNRKELYIFNGQQRIVTMFLLLCNIRDILSRTKAKDRKKFESTLSKINLLFFQNKLPNGSFTHFKIQYEGSNDMNILLSNIADPASFAGTVKETEGTTRLKEANLYTKKWLNSHFEDDFETLHEFAKFLLGGVFFAGQYHSDNKRAESAFIESNLIQVHLTPIDLLRGKLISYVNPRKQIQMAHTFNAIDQMLRSNKFYTNSNKVRINELLLKHSISVQFSQPNKGLDVMDFVFNINEKKAQEIVDKYYQWVDMAIKARSDINEGYEYIFLKIIASKNVFSWTKAVAYNMIVSKGETLQNRKVLLDLMIPFVSMYYGSSASPNILEVVANEFCQHIKQNPDAKWNVDVNKFYNILATKINEDSRDSRHKQQVKNLDNNAVVTSLIEQIKSFTFQRKLDRQMMRLVLCFVEAILQHEIGGENLYIAFKRIYDNKQVKLKQLSPASVSNESDYHNKLGNVTLSYDAKKPLKLYLNSNFASEFEKMKSAKKMTKNMDTVLDSIKTLISFSDVKTLDENKCKKRLDFITTAFRHYWKPEVLVKLQASPQQRAAAAKKDGIAKSAAYTARIEDITKNVAPAAPAKKQAQKVA